MTNLREPLSLYMFVTFMLRYCVEEMICMGYEKLLIWGAVFALVMGLLYFDNSLWPILFIIPVLIIAVSIIYSMVATHNLYKKDPKASLLVGRLNYGIDARGRPTKKYHLK
jgi:hypothetical protein